MSQQKPAPAWPVYRAPENRLPASPTITTCEQAETALFELSFLLWFAKQVQTVVDQECAPIKEHALELLRQDGVELTSRTKELQQALEKFGDKHRATILPPSVGKAKKRELSHGVLSYRNSPARIDTAEETSEHDVLQGIKEKCGWVNAVSEWLQTLFVGAVPLSKLCRVELRIDNSAALEAWQKKELSAKQLEAIGLRHVESAEKFTAKPREYVITT